MVLGFKTHINGQPTFFIEKILTCVSAYYSQMFLPKKHSIREGKRWTAGRKIHMATGVRTTKYNQFNKFIAGLDTCKSVQDIAIKWKLTEGDDVNNPFVTLVGKRCVWIKVDGRLLDKDEVRTLALNDGFDGILQFLDWFKNDIDGQIIHWTDLKY